MGPDAPAKTYRLILYWVIVNALLSIGQALIYIVVIGGMVIFAVVKQLNIDETALNVFVSICAVIGLIGVVAYLWQRMHFARTFSITSDNTGLTLQEDRKIVKVAWNEVVSFEKYRVVGTKGEVIDLREELSDRDNLKEVIEKNAAKSITENLITRFEREGRVSVGIIEITSKGLSFEGKFIAWENVAAMGIDEEKEGKFVRVTEMPGFRPRRIAPISKIPYHYALDSFFEILGPKSPIVLPPVPPRLTSGVIFISYRRSDSDHVAGRIYDKLVECFGKDSVFMDVESIPYGLNFKEILDKKLEECKVFLALIGDGWLDSRDIEGKRRLEDPKDYVRTEIESALERNIRLIPLLVGRAPMPSMEALPDSLRDFVLQNGIVIRPNPDFRRDMDRLIDSLKPDLQ